MRCIRILPDTWARTLWPLSISTRNIALGSGSTTLPSTSIASSLLMAFRFRLSSASWTDAQCGSGLRCRRRTEHDGSRDLDSPSRTGRSRHPRAYHASGACPHRLLGWERTASSLEDDLHELGYLLVALVFRLDADDPAGLKVGQRERLLHEASLARLGGPDELDDLGPGLEVHHHLAGLALGRRFQRDGPRRILRAPGSGPRWAAAPPG